jgi:predicted tellurium resistance membrane protein TerC
VGSILATFTHPASWIAVLTLALLEIVLGIDNLVFIAILTGKLPKADQKPARQLGLAAALVTRLMLLFSISWIARLTTPILTIHAFQVHGKDFALTGQSIVLLGGGLFLIYKAVTEIYHKVELGDEGIREAGVPRSLVLVVINIALMDIIFSLDSVITAVGMVNDIPVMVAGIVIAMIVMVAFADPVSNFINEHASLKILALSFLLMIGTLLTGEAIGFEVPKAVVYGSMFFALGVQLVQMRYEANLEKRLAERAPQHRPTKKDRTEQGNKQVT